MYLDKARNKVWQQVLRNRLRSPDCQLACLLSRGFNNSGKSLIGDLFYFVCKWQQHFATCCERDTSSASIEERNPDFVLQGLHLLGHRGLRQQQFLRCTAEVQVMCNRSKDADSEVF